MTGHYQKQVILANGWFILNKKICYKFKFIFVRFFIWLNADGE